MKYSGLSPVERRRLARRVHPGPGAVLEVRVRRQRILNIGDQRRALLLRGRKARRLAQAVALQHLRRGNFEQPALLQGRQFPGVGDGKEALQRVGAGVPRRAPTGRLQHQSRSGTRLAGQCGSHGNTPSILPNRRRARHAGARWLSWRMPMTFAERLARAQHTSGSLVCVGLDPDPAKLPRICERSGRSEPPCMPSTAASSMRRPTSRPPTSRRSPSTARSARRTSWPRASATSASARRPRWSFSTPSATTSAIPPRPMRAKPSIATAPMR